MPAKLLFLLHWALKWHFGWIKLLSVGNIVTLKGTFKKNPGVDVFVNL